MSKISKMFKGSSSSSSSSKSKHRSRTGPSPQEAIHKLRETEEMLTKKQDYLEKKIEQEIIIAKRNGMKNKRGTYCMPIMWALIFHAPAFLYSIYSNSRLLELQQLTNNIGNTIVKASRSAACEYPTKLKASQVMAPWYNSVWNLGLLHSLLV